MEIKFCYRHPENIARGRCYYCKRNICSHCRQLIAHHYFCSRTCYYRFLRQLLWKRLRKHQVMLLVVWNGILTVLLVAYILFHNEKATGNPEPLPFLADSIEMRATSWSKATGRYLSFMARDPQVHREVVNERIYELKVPLKRGWVVTIWHNDWPVISQIAPTTMTYAFPISLWYGKNRQRVVVLNEQQELIYDYVFELDYRSDLVEQLSTTIDRGDVQRPFVALTFDGGSTAENAEQILNILREQQVQCTIFLTGQFMERYPHLVKQMIADGHEVANHTYSHPHLTTFEFNQRHDTRPGVDRRFIHRQLLQTDSLFFHITGQHLAPFWRAPYGEYNQDILRWAAEAGFLHVRWTNGFDTFDWVSDSLSPLYREPEEVLNTILSRDRTRFRLNGAIILMHLGSRRAQSPIYSILPTLIDSLRSRGYQPVPISKLLQP